MIILVAGLCISSAGFRVVVHFEWLRCRTKSIVQCLDDCLMPSVVAWLQLSHDTRRRMSSV